MASGAIDQEDDMEPGSVSHPAGPVREVSDEQILAVLIDELIFQGLLHP